MSWPASISYTGVALGETISGVTSVTADANAGSNVAVAAAKTGTLTTRTDDNTGVATMTGGHGFATSDRLDVYWDGGRRYGMTATVAVNAVTIDGGGGDVLPSTSTALTVMIPNLETCDFDGDDLVFLQGGASVACVAQFIFAQTDGTFIAAVTLEDVTASLPWFAGCGFTNPLAGVDVGRIYSSHDDSSQSITLKAVALYE